MRPGSTLRGSPWLNTAVSLSTRDARFLPLLGHLEELRKRIVFSVLGVLVGFVLCWSYADRIFGLMQEPIIRALRRHGLAGGLVYLNPTEPFNLYLQVALVGGLFAASPIRFLPIVALHRAGIVSQGAALCSALLT